MAAQISHSKTSLISLFDQHFLVLPLYFVVIMDMVISNLVAEQPVAIFSKNSCCISHTIKLLIRSFGASPTVYELDELPNGKQIERALVAMGQKPSVPVVFIGQQLVGGSNEVMSLHLKGRLVPMLIQARAIWV